MGSPEHESFGFLLGRLLYCPWTKSSFVLMDQAWQASGPLPTKDQTLAFREAWTSAWQAARRRRLQVVGWYHSHGLLGLQLSVRDMEIHRRYFPDPWQTALIVVPGADGPIGGFIQRRSALFFAQSLVPFYEVLDADAVWRDDTKPSWVDWENYSTEEPVQIVAPSMRPKRESGRESVAESPPETEAAVEAVVAEAAPAVVEPPSETESEAPSAEAEPEPREREAVGPRTEPAQSTVSEEATVPQTGKRSFEEEAQDFADAARATSQFYDPREGSVSLPWPVLPDLGDAPLSHRGPFQKHLPLPTRRAPRPGKSAAIDQKTPSRERSRFMEVVRAPAPYRTESKESALEARQSGSDPGLPSPDRSDAAVNLDPVAEAKVSLLESGAPAVESVEEAIRPTAHRSRMPFRLEPLVEPAAVDGIGTKPSLAMAAEGIEPVDPPAPLDSLARWLAAYNRAEARRIPERVSRERAEAERVDRERAEAERLAAGPRAPEPGPVADADADADVTADSDEATQRTLPFGIDSEPSRAPTPVSVPVDEPAAVADEPAAVADEPAAVARPAQAAVRADVAAKPGDYGDDEYEYTVPVVMPAGQRFALLAGLRRHFGKIAAFIFIAGAIAAAMMLPIGGEPTPTSPYVAPPISSAVRDFSRSAEELGRQISAYEATQARFDARETDCAALAASQAGVSQAFVALAERFAVVGARLALSERLEYERLAGAARETTGHFEAAGCAETP